MILEQVGWTPGLNSKVGSRRLFLRSTWNANVMRRAVELRRPNTDISDVLRLASVEQTTPTDDRA